jgi:RNA polymerase sigma-70 factor (ECF subfamily)
MIGETIRPFRDEQLIMNIARGDRDALAEIYLLHKSAVYAFAMSILRQAHAAEDVMQETFLQLWNAAGTYVPRGQSALPWLLGITKNTALKHMRTVQRAGIPMEELPDPPNPSDPFLAVENRIVTKAVMEKLSAEERQIVVLHAVAGMKHREIAELLDKPLSTILNKYRRALKKLETYLGEQV